MLGKTRLSFSFHNDLFGDFLLNGTNGYPHSEDLKVDGIEMDKWIDGVDEVSNGMQGRTSGVKWHLPILFRGSFLGDKRKKDQGE